MQIPLRTSVSGYVWYSVAIPEAANWGQVRFVRVGSYSAFANGRHDDRIEPISDVEKRSIAQYVMV